ncbi:GGDEF domain-containing protein [Shewanella algae]|uniref:GGDEF domain-containing protein n=1 Tax=Shewanella algae TaxID=38313 RepID=UPI001AAC4ED3|nr:GGDEF domain-containing protein [Shewanella algae]MBO2560286.1 GGDEF domain-containing protein [Shewanella algae]
MDCQTRPNTQTPRSTSLGLPGIRSRLLLSFFLLAGLIVFFGGASLWVMERTGKAHIAELQDQKLLLQTIKANQMQHLALLKLKNNWPTYPSNEREAILDETRQRQQQIITTLSQFTLAAKEYDEALALGQQLSVMSGQPLRAPHMTGMISAIDNLSLRLSGIGLTHLDAQAQKNSKSLMQTLLWLVLGSLALIVLSQTVAWTVLGRHLLKPLLQTSHKLSELAEQNFGGNSPNAVNRETLKINHALLSLEAQMSALTSEQQQDELTGLNNRRSFNQLLKQSWHKGIVRQHRIGLLLIQSDQAIASETLLHLAQRLLDFEVSGEHFLARLQQSQLALLLPDQDPEACIRIAQSLNQFVLAANLRAKAQSPRLTVSIGVANIQPARQLGWDTLVFQAEEALLSAQNRGGNCSAGANQ